MRGINPGRFANIVPIDPFSNDSDEDGMPDGWEFAYDLDPTDPYDRDLDRDNDGVRFDPSSDYIDRPWTNLDEYVSSLLLLKDSTELILSIQILTGTVSLMVQNTGVGSTQIRISPVTI